jgi:transposase
MLKPKSPQESFYGSYLYDRIIPNDHLLRKIDQVVDFSFVGKILKDRYNPAIGRPAEDPGFLLRLCLLSYWVSLRESLIENRSTRERYSLSGTPIMKIIAYGRILIR